MSSLGGMVDLGLRAVEYRGLSHCSSGGERRCISIEGLFRSSRSKFCRGISGGVSLLTAAYTASWGLFSLADSMCFFRLCLQHNNPSTMSIARRTIAAVPTAVPAIIGNVSID